MSEEYAGSDVEALEDLLAGWVAALPVLVELGPTGRAALG